MERSTGKPQEMSCVSAARWAISLDLDRGVPVRDEMETSSVYGSRPTSKIANAPRNLGVLSRDLQESKPSLKSPAHHHVGYWERTS